ncbi:hypothetical protein [Planctobacterium marinum]|uniref:hypothetical protein n=1 Tax=Planctobacterium marinum TaxID=1631968 RepID=UPI001E3262A0|nr:hypothetical protein [Planctobacterium marinum]MCC2605543.1 hypothetical protein [Planctobacterium marinum]
MSFQQALMWCDASNTQELLNTYEHFKCTRRFESKLIACLKQTESDRAASWILKHHLEQGFQLDEAHSIQVLDCFMLMQHWESRLHILQSLSQISIASEVSHNLFQNLKALLDNSRKFIRAWAYNGIHEVALQYPYYQSEVASLLQRVDDTEVASVKARVNKILKTGYYDLQRECG